MGSSSVALPETHQSSDFRPERRITFLDAITNVQSRLGHQRSSRCARAGHVSGYYRVAKQLAGHQRGSTTKRLYIYILVWKIGQDPILFQVPVKGGYRNMYAPRHQGPDRAQFWTR